ncbi:hypothetical protein V8E53_013573 [Lactarius tabidus]
MDPARWENSVPEIREYGLTESEMAGPTGERRKEWHANRSKSLVDDIGKLSRIIYCG